MVHWPCGREVWWDLSLQRYDFFLNLQAKSLKFLSKTGFFCEIRAEIARNNTEMGYDGGSSETNEPNCL